MSILDDISQERPRPIGALGWTLEILRTWGPVLIAILVIRTFVFEPFRIPSGSMVPTLLIGDNVFVTKFSYGLWMPTGRHSRVELLDLGSPERGDVIVFKYPKDPAWNYIKRVVALPGEKITVKNNQIFIDGDVQDRKYLERYVYEDDNCSERRTRLYTEDLGDLTHYKLTNSSTAHGRLANYDGMVVPPDSVFVMGDNRDNSEDSRSWGIVKHSQIKGKAHFVLFSWDSCEDGLRSDRFFSPLYDPDQPAP